MVEIDDLDLVETVKKSHLKLKNQELILLIEL